MRYHVAVVGLVALALVIAPSLMRLAVATTAETVWTSIGPAGEYVQALAIDPQRPTTLFAGTRDHGVYKSTDGGRSWQAVNSGLNNLSVSALVVDSRNPTTIYAGIGQVSTNTGGAFKSTDGGGSWREINNGLTNTNLTIYALAVDPRTPTTLYAGTWGGVLKSTDAGGTWRAMNTGLDATGLKSNLDPAYANLTERFVFALAIDPRTPTTIYAVTSFGLGHEVHGVFKSTDGARNWRVLSTDLAGLSLVGLAIDPQTPTTLYARSKESGVFKSTDGGESWRGINNGLADLRVNALAIDHRTPTTLYAGTWHGVFESTDGGGNWRAANDGLTDLSAVVLAITPDTPTTLYAGTWGSGVFVSGSVPGIRASPTPQAGPPAETGAVTYLSVAEDGSVWLAIEIRGDLPLYAGSRKTILYRTSSSGDRWEKAVEISGHGAIKRLWLFGSGRVSALLDDVIIHTADGGIRWRSSPAFGEVIIGISLINPAEGWMLVSIGAGMSHSWPALYHTLDGGDHWTEIVRVEPGRLGTSGLSAEYKTGIEFRDASNGWIGTVPITGRGYLYVSHDGGATWKEQSLPPPTGMADTNFVRVLPPKFLGSRSGVAVALLAQGQEAVPFVYATSDKGDTWSDPRPLPISPRPGAPLPLDFLSPSIWAAASNQSLWLSSDAGRTWSEHSVPLPPTYKIDRVALVSPTRVLLVGSGVPPNRRRPVADYVLETSDAGLHWTRVLLPQVH